VVAAAEAVARDDRPPALPEDGPLEIATLGRSFNRWSTACPPPSRSAA
jgi:hypothetical protein